MQDLVPLPGVEPGPPELGAQSLTHWATREVPFLSSFLSPARRFSLVVASGGHSSLQCVASHCSGFSCCRARALGMWASVVEARGLSSCGLRALECRLSSCGTWAQLLRSMWDLPGPGVEPMSPTLAGRFLTTAPAGKSFPSFLILLLWVFFSSW